MRALVVVATVAAVVASVMIATDAAAAVEQIELSGDGKRFSQTLGSEMFGDIGAMVPSDERSGRFWLRNGTRQEAYLRMTVGDVSASDDSYASALSLLATVDGIKGERISFASQPACADLVPPVRLRPGQVVEIGAILALGNLERSSAQGARIAMVMKVSLSDVAANSQQLSCERSGVDIPLIMPAPQEPSNSPTPTGSKTSSAAVPPPVDSPPAVPPFASTGVLKEYATLWPIFAFLVGAAGFLFARRRWRNGSDNREEGRLS